MCEDRKFMEYLCVLNLKLFFKMKFIQKGKKKVKHKLCRFIQLVSSRSSFVLELSFYGNSYSMLL